MLQSLPDSLPLSDPSLSDFFFLAESESEASRNKVDVRRWLTSKENDLGPVF
jgi:hypothetical protein